MIFSQHVDHNMLSNFQLGVSGVPIVHSFFVHAQYFLWPTSMDDLNHRFVIFKVYHMWNAFVREAIMHWQRRIAAIQQKEK